MKAKATHKANIFTSLADVLDNWHSYNHEQLKAAFDNWYDDIQREQEEWGRMLAND